MKKILLLACFGMATMAVTQRAGAQVSALTGTSGLALDTITNADATSFKTGKQLDKELDIVVKFTKISGTVAGSVKWEVSVDNTTFYVVASDTLTDATNVYGHSFVKGAETQASKKWVYHRATIATTGTSSASVSVKAWDHN